MMADLMVDSLFFLEQQNYCLKKRNSNGIVIENIIEEFAIDINIFYYSTIIRTMTMTSCQQMAIQAISSCNIWPTKMVAISAFY